MAINVSSVLFVGLSKYIRKPELTYHGSYTFLSQMHLDGDKWRTANNITAIYNFELHKWEQQDYLNLYNSKTDYSYELSCTIVHGKAKNR